MQLVSLCGVLAALAPACFAASPWPIPSTYNSGSTVLWITPDVQVTYNGAPASSYGNGSSPNSIPTTNTSITSSSVVSAAWARASTTIFSQNFVPWKFHPRFSNFEPAPNGNKISSIALQQNGTDPPDFFKAAAGAIDESYSLSLTTDGAVTISGKSSIGLVRGLTTFTQLFYAHSQGGAYTPSAPVIIQDAPKFPWRALNFDVARDYFPVADILRQIDAIAFNKFNRLHLHITDSQSWPLVIPTMPELSGKGAYRSDYVYTPSDIAQIQAYGAMQGIEVIIETDMPGHTGSIALSHPELIAGFNVQPNWYDYAAEPPSGVLKLGNSSGVPQFLQSLYADILPRVQPYNAYYHTGGDEVKYEAFTLDDSVGNTNDTSVLKPLMQAFVDRNHKQVFGAGLTPLVWEEILLTWNLTLDQRVIVQSWQSDDSVASIVKQGHYALAGNYNYWYLDCGQGQWVDFTPDVSGQYAPYVDYCSPRKNWRVVYSYDPLEGVPSNSSSKVLGGVVHIWTEQTDPVNLDRMVWPRAAAAGEVLWSGAKDPVTGQNRSQVEASPRLAEMRERLVAKGVLAEPVHMVFCTQNGTQCSDNQPASAS